MATVSKENAPQGFRSQFFKDKEGLKLKLDEKGKEQINENSEGYVYVFKKDGFIKEMRWNMLLMKMLNLFIYQR
jgi:hypothetical protein